MEASVVLSRALVASSHNLPQKKKKNQDKGSLDKPIICKSIYCEKSGISSNAFSRTDFDISRDYVNSHKSTKTELITDWLP